MKQVLSLQLAVVSSAAREKVFKSRQSVSLDWFCKRPPRTGTTDLTASLSLVGVTRVPRCCTKDFQTHSRVVLMCMLSMLGRRAPAAGNDPAPANSALRFQTQQGESESPGAHQAIIQFVKLRKPWSVLPGDRPLQLRICLKLKTFKLTSSELLAMISTFNWVRQIVTLPFLTFQIAILGNSSLEMREKKNFLQVSGH